MSAWGGGGGGLKGLQMTSLCFCPSSSPWLLKEGQGECLRGDADGMFVYLEGEEQITSHSDGGGGCWKEKMCEKGSFGIS
jgi:hypothetical protein